MEELLHLRALGWDAWFDAQATDRCVAGSVPARVAAVDRDQLLVLGNDGAFRAKLSGRFLYATESSAERPCVGDWVCVAHHPQDEYGVIHERLERRTYLRRKAAGHAAEQMIAANVDAVVIVQSCHFDFNVNRLERYLVMAGEGGAAPIILLTKTDLVSPETLAGQIGLIRSAGITARVVTLSNVTGEGLHDLKGMLEPAKTYCFVGSSGVGKSTLINGLMGRDLQETKLVSGTGEGRHTTVRRELILLENGAIVIDNPGMREFGILAGEADVAASFSDIHALGTRCRFRDCTHTNEPGCAVLEAVARGEVDRGHYENFLKLRRESEFHELTDVEKRQKDKKFGKFVKSVKKTLADD